MRSIRERLTYANVMSSIAVFLVLGGGAAFAAVNLPANSVGSKQIKKKAVKTRHIAIKAVRTGRLAPEAAKAGKIAKNAIVTNRLRDNAVATDKIQDDAVTGDKVKESTLGEVPTAADAQKVGGKSTNDIAMWAFVNLDGTLIRSSGGVSSAQLATGTYDVTFPRAIDTCAYTASNAATDNVNPAPNEIAVAKAAGATNVVRVRTDTSDGTAPVNDQFMLVVTC